MFDKKITMIAAVAQNGVIGKEGELLWDIPEDLRWFRAYTVNGNIVMGRKTMDSLIARNGGPLPDRVNYVLSRKKVNQEGFIQITLEELLEKAETENFMVIGGGEIYELLLDYAHTLYITHVHKAFEGDARFPKIDPEEWAREWKDGPRGRELQYTFARYLRT